MNFDNLEEDAIKHGANVTEAIYKENAKAFHFYKEELQALILEYIERDRAQGQEPVGYCNSSELKDMKVKKQSANLWHKQYPDCDTPIFTHAQPTPEQIAEFPLADDMDGPPFFAEEAIKNWELRKGESL